MAQSVVFQGITPDSHLAAVRQVLAIPDPQRLLISTAFMNERGLRLLEDDLAPVTTQTTILAGIRNGITSAQGLRRSLAIGCSTYAVDTGSRTVLFHPKIYFSRNENEARLIIGSANLTVGGLNGNIEASLLLTLDLEDEANAALVDELEDKIDGMIAEYQEHVFEVPSNAMIQRLLDSGRVVDESIVPPPTPAGSSSDRNLDTVPRMILRTQSIIRQRVAPIPRTAGAATGGGPAAAVAPGIATPVMERLSLAWESKPLTRRYLTIPTGATTNPTGSMLFTKGEMEDIDQRHYFRDEVFDDLVWHFDTAAGREHLERAEARFHLIIRDVDYGVFTLRLSHNSRTDTASYEQRNSQTQLHWGDARPLVAREDLLGRTMYLYRDTIEEDLFVLEID